MRFTSLLEAGSRWGISAAGSAFEWHSRGRGFESHMLHFFLFFGLGGDFMPTEKELTDSLLQMYAENRRARYAQDIVKELDYQAAMLKERLAHLGVTDLSKFENR